MQFGLMVKCAAMHDVLGILFGSAARVKILRLFLGNADTCFTVAQIAKHAKVDSRVVRKETNSFLKVGLLKKTTCVEVVTKGRGSKKKEITKRSAGMVVDRSFEHFYALRSFVLNIAPTDNENIVKKLGAAGTPKLVLIAGVFIQDPDSRVDLLVVGDTMKDAQLKDVVRDLEAQMGRELRFAAFTTKDFIYRLGIYDRLVRDILDYPHQVLIDKLDGNWRETNMQKRRQ